MASFMPGNIGENLYQFCHPIIITGWPQSNSTRCNMPNKTKSYCLYKPLILLQMTHMLLPQMLERKRGVIINVCSSVSCVPPIPLTTGYTATMVIHLIAILYNYVTWVCLLISISLAHHYVFIRLMLAVSLKHCTVKIDTGESLSRFVVAQSSKWTMQLFRLYISLCRHLCRVLWPQKKWLHPSSPLLLQPTSGMPSKHLVSLHILVATGLMHCR